MREKDFQKRVTDMATRFGWKWWHVPVPMRWSPKDKKFVPSPEGGGIPDLILMHHDPPRLVFLELKSDDGDLSDKQREFLQAAKVLVDMLREDDADSAVWMGRNVEGFAPSSPVGVIAAWPKDEAAVEQMLRSKVVA